MVPVRAQVVCDHEEVLCPGGVHHACVAGGVGECLHEAAGKVLVAEAAHAAVPLGVHAARLGGVSVTNSVDISYSY